MSSALTRVQNGKSCSRSIDDSGCGAISAALHQTTPRLTINSQTEYDEILKHHRERSTHTDLDDLVCRDLYFVVFRDEHLPGPSCFGFFLELGCFTTKKCRCVGFGHHEKGDDEHNTEGMKLIREVMLR